MGAAHRKIMIIAGPNGTGKATFATGLNPFRPAAVAVRAGCLMVDTIRESADRGASFAFETTGSGRSQGRSIPCRRAQVDPVKPFFLRRPTPEMALACVRRRGAAGRHDVPEALVRRRAAAEWRNFERIHRAWADEWTVIPPDALQREAAEP